MKKKVYIAGKITGVPDFQKKFQEAAEEFEKRGYVVLNPAILPAGMKPGDYMRICLSQIDVADEVHFMPCYVDSPGAQVELKYSEYCEKEITYGKTAARKLLPDCPGYGL